jgi:flagellar assembly protein FliH
MPTPLRLEDFGGLVAPTKNLAQLPNLEAAATAAAPSTDTLDAYDKGYAAGWDDATKAAKAEETQADLNLRQSLEDLGFTYHEARVHVMGALSPLLSALMRKVVPRMLQDTLGARLIEEVEAMADSAVDLPVDLMANPADAAALRPVIEAVKTLPMRLVEERTVAPGQMFLKAGTAEREIDLTGALTAITEALEALDDLNKEQLRHG